MGESRKLVLIDGHSILNRAFYGLPELTNAQGLHTNAVYGFLNIMFKILEEEKPDYLAVAFDVHAPTFRHEMYEAYKGTRKPMPEELREQVPVLKDVLKAMRIVIVEQAGLEADDILGTLAKKAQSAGMEVSLVSGDRDLLQIADEHIKIRIPKTKQGRTEIENYYPADVEKAYGVTPLQFIDLKALMGDTADNIPGVPKVGQKTAGDLMAQYGSLDEIYAHAEEITKKSIRDSLMENRDLADLSKTLATIRIDCEVELDYEAARAEGYYTPEAYQLFKQLEFKNLLNRFESGEKGEESRELAKTFVRLHTEKELLDRLESVRDRAETGLFLAAEGERLLGIAVSVREGETFFLAVREPENEQLSLFGNGEDGQLSLPGDGMAESGTDGEKLKKALQQLSRRVRISTFDIKGQYRFLAQDTTERYFDILIGAYLLNPLKSDYDVETIASEHLGLMLPGRGELLGKAGLREASGQQPDKFAEYCCYSAYVSLQAAPVLAEKLQAAGMDRLMREMEMPLSLVLYDMERAGVEVRRAELKAYGDALVERIEELERSVHAQAGVEFNINSPKQLGEVLFDTMKLPGGKKTKTGYSTAADVLEKLSEDYPIVNDILEYRTLTKLKSTYADGLAVYIGEDNRIHTNFNQTITATGRISSTEPNLQNIPMRMELGRRIRKVFVPGAGYEFMDADYSQIELRVLAHMSGDEQLIEAYRMDQDIHRITAAKVFHTPFEEVTDLQRRNAKAVNFGIVYGISSFGLSQDLSISRKEAAEYIEQYFTTYPKVKEFLDKLVKDAREQGYITTMFGRRRPVPELASSNFMQRSFGERVAMNSPIQGTAADIIKIAMIRVWKALRDAKLKSRLILQVHDELVIETALEEEEQVRQILTENMKAAADLAVTLEIDLHTGENWYEAK
ncbi:MAG: DNA polymerase I [Butyrivibrio sp.]|nr:DNA polymerase I [Acetatifactor muris]MCM1560597.1 DNA polymerase I [Butyrivibrio sp.]